MFFWDQIEVIAPNTQFILLLIPFIQCLTSGKKRCFTKRLGLLAGIVFLHGVVNIVAGNDNISLFIIQYGSIFFCIVVFETIIENYTVNKIFSIYWKAAFIMSVIGVIEVVLCIFNNPILANIPIVFSNTAYSSKAVWIFPRICALCQEPSFLGYFLAPAMGIIVFQLIAPEYIDKDFLLVKRKFACLCIAVTYMMTFSFVAYVGLALMILAAWWSKGISIKKLLIPIFAIAIAVITYLTIADIRLRIDDTIAVFTGAKSGSMVNLTSYTYYSNWTVAMNSFKSSFGFGTGLGSYRFMFDKFNLGEWGMSGIAFNREDGNSMLFRIMVELGVLGIIAVIYFIKKYFPQKNRMNYVFGISIFVLMVMLLFRMGNYTHGALVLFVCLYRKCQTEQNRNLVMNS